MMKEERSQSPFAALTSQEQKERWICWQSQKARELQDVAKPTAADLRSESVSDDAKPTTSRFVEEPRHRQYDAVMRRMQQATRKTSAYMDCSTKHEPSGSP